jgi:hypothetical protein
MFRLGLGKARKVQATLFGSFACPAHSSSVELGPTATEIEQCVRKAAHRCKNIFESDEFKRTGSVQDS